MDRTFFERYYQAYNSEDPEQLAAFYHEDVVLVSAQGEQRGRDAVLDTYRFITGSFRDRMTPENILVDGGQGAVEIRDEFEARQDVDDFLGASFKKGDTFTLRLCAVYTVEDERITRAVIYQR